MKKINKFTPKIDCPIFSEYEEKINELTQAINGAKIISDKVNEAKDLLTITDKLSNCPKYDEEKEDCITCRFILKLSKETADLIIKASEPSE